MGGTTYGLKSFEYKKELNLFGFLPKQSPLRISPAPQFLETKFSLPLSSPEGGTSGFSLPPIFSPMLLPGCPLHSMLFSLFVLVITSPSSPPICFPNLRHQKSHQPKTQQVPLFRVKISWVSALPALPFPTFFNLFWRTNFAWDCFFHFSVSKNILFFATFFTTFLPFGQKERSLVCYNALFYNHDALPVVLPTASSFHVTKPAP